MRPTGYHRASAQTALQTLQDLETHVFQYRGRRSLRYVDGSVGTGGRGTSWSDAFQTWTEAIAASIALDVILIAPYSYDESPTIPYALAGLTIGVVGSRDYAAIAPQTAGASGLTVHAAGVELLNLDLACPDTVGDALIVTGNGFTARGCKLEGGARQAVVGPGTNAQAVAHTAGHGGDMRFEDCEFAWGTRGFVVKGTDYGAATQIRVRGCLFHNLTASSIDEAVGSGGSAAVTFRNFWIEDNDFSGAEDGTQPTKYVQLAADNANTGDARGNRFPVALNSGKNLVSTALLWSGNFHPAGLSTTQPS